MKPDHSDTDKQQSIQVEQSILEAAEAIEAEAAELGISDVLLADYQRVVEQESGRRDEAQAWAAVHYYLMSLTCQAAGTPVNVVPDSRFWAVRGPVRRPPTHR